MTKWLGIRTNDPNRDTISALFDNKIAAIVIPRFFSEENCKMSVKEILDYGFDYYENVYPKIGKIGITQFEHRYDLRKKSEYFQIASKANSERKKIFKKILDPLDSVINFIQNSWKVDANIAIEEDIQKEYFAGLIRIINNALLHVDWAQFDGPEWTIGKISAQVSWNIYLQVSIEGGAIVLYNKSWEKSDEQYKIKDSYGYKKDVVEGTDSVRIIPRVGDLVLFNSRNFHEVETTKGEVERITISSFIGLTDTEKLIFWS